MSEINWDLDLDVEKGLQSNVSKTLDSSKIGIMPESFVKRLEILRSFEKMDSSFPEVAEETGYSYQSMHQLDLKKDNWIEKVGKDGRTPYFTATEKAEEVIDTFYSEGQPDFFEQETTVKSIVSGLTETFYNSPESFEALNRIGEENDWEGLVNRLEEKYIEQKEGEGKELHPSKEPVTDFTDTTPSSTLSGTPEDTGPNEESKRELERIRNIRKNGQNSSKRNGYRANGSGQDYDFVEEALEVYSLEDELTELNQELRDELGVQLSGVTSVSDGFYATDVVNGPWHVKVDERELPDSFDYLVVEESSSRSSGSGLRAGEVEGFVEETDTGFSVYNHSA